MSRTSIHLAIPVTVLLQAALPGPAAADGMAFRTLGASTEVRATDQRAVMWLRGYTWEIHIQPVFSREAGGAAWVVPFPLRPEVHESNADFFDQLELVTSPVFLTTCWESSSGPGCFPFAAERGGANEDAQNATISIIVWERGEVGDLDYAILSATDGTSLVDWLGAEGYEIPAGADALIAGLDTEGVFFFASRLSASADPGRPIAPVRFVLPSMDLAVYPLRLTSLGATADEPLDLTLWIIVPDEMVWVPSSHPTSRLDANPRSIEEFDDALDELFASGGPSTLAVLAYLSYQLPSIIDDQMFCDEGWSCATFSQLGIDPPETWADEIVEIATEVDAIYRYQGRLHGAGLEMDLVLEHATSADRPWVHNVYTHSEGECKEGGDCSVAGDGGTTITLLIAALAALAILAWARRSRS